MLLFLLLRSADLKGQDFGMLCCVVWLCFFHCCHSYWHLKLFVHGSGNNQQWNPRSAVLLVVVFRVLRVSQRIERKWELFGHSLYSYSSLHMYNFILWSDAVSLGEWFLMFQSYAVCSQHQDVLTEWPSFTSLATLVWESQILHEGTYFSWFSFLVCQLVILQVQVRAC